MSAASLLNHFCIPILGILGIQNLIHITLLTTGMFIWYIYFNY